MCLEEKEQEEGDGDCQGACCRAGASVRGRERDPREDSGRLLN